MRLMLGWSPAEHLHIISCIAPSRSVHCSMYGPLWVVRVVYKINPTPHSCYLPSTNTTTSFGAWWGPMWAGRQKSNTTPLNLARQKILSWEREVWQEVRISCKVAGFCWRWRYGCFESWGLGCRDWDNRSSLMLLLFGITRDQDGAVPPRDTILRYDSRCFWILRYIDTQL